MKRIPVVLAGGKGERFWPLSREDKPKQLLSLITKKPLILETYERLKVFDDFYVVANKKLCDAFKALLPTQINYIVEPIGRNTAPAIGYACMYLSAKYDDCIVIIEPADAYHIDLDNYTQVMIEACDYAADNAAIIMIGISPSHPHTGYGYVRIGNHIKGSIFSVRSFNEKPDIETARRFLEAGNYCWDAGKFIAKCSVLIDEIKLQLPEIYDHLVAIRDSNFDEEVIKNEFNQIEKISIDVGIMEKSDKLAILKSSMDWDDVGDFNSIARIRKDPDLKGNYTLGNIKAISSSSNIVISEKLVALIGVNDLIVVDTSDALLVCSRDKSQEIKKLVKCLEQKYK